MTLPIVSNTTSNLNNNTCSTGNKKYNGKKNMECNFKTILDSKVAKYSKEMKKWYLLYFSL